MQNKKYKVVEGNMSTEYAKRWAVVSVETGKVLDDAQGYGYKTIQKAYAAFGYKNRDKSKDKQKIELAKKIKEWDKESHFFSFLDGVAFDVLKGSYGPDVKINAKFVKELLEDIECPFTARDLLWYWKHGEKLLKKKKKRRK